jgi:hypothetical protein
MRRRSDFISKLKLTHGIIEDIVKGVISSVIHSWLRGEDDVSSGGCCGAGSGPLRLWLGWPGLHAGPHGEKAGQA